MFQLTRIKMFRRLAMGLRKYLKEPVTLSQSQKMIRQDLVNRERNLLAMVKSAVYEYPSSPYQKLLKMVDCEYGDFEKMIQTEGIEKTLLKLYEQGVYLSIEEFKGRTDVVRGSSVFRFEEGDFDNPFLYTHMETRTSGSRSAGTRVRVDLERYRHFAMWTRVMYDVSQIWESPVLVWLPILPGAGIAKLLWLAKMNKPPARWFSQIQANSVKPDLSKRLATYYIIYAGRLFGAPLPRPEYVSFSNAENVALAMVEALHQGRGCVLETYTSSAVRVCQVAQEKSIDLSGATFVVGGEPLTQAKRDEIQASGARVVSVYAIADMGLMGFSCPAPDKVDEVHLFGHAYSAIQREREVLGGSVTVQAFLFTTIFSRSAKILLNVESGDYGRIERRKCGCRFDELGLVDHLCDIRGFDKLTGEGMSFIGTDLLRILESVLPKRFGGASTDYQIVEEEDEQGHTRLTVLVSPEIGAVDEKDLIQIMVDELGKGKDVQRFMARIWSDAGILRVKRKSPIFTNGAKLLPLHIQNHRR